MKKKGEFHASPEATVSQWAPVVRAEGKRRGSKHKMVF